MAAGNSPIYLLQCRIRGCACDIRCNDAPLLIQKTALAVIVELPLNSWIRNGNNIITAAVNPPAGRSFDRNSKLEVILYQRQALDDRNARREVSRFSCTFVDARTPQTDATIVPAEPGFLLSRDFAATVPFPESRWFENLGVTNDEGTRVDLLGQYWNIHRALVNRDLEAVLSRFHFKTAETAAAYYIPLAEREAEVRAQLGRLFGNSDAQLQEVRPSASLRVYGHGRLARLELENGECPIYYLLTKFNVAQSMSLMFTKGRGGDWLVIR